MAPGRLYRDYSLDDDSWGVPRQRTPSLKHSFDPAASPRTVVSDIREDDEQSVGLDDYGTAITTTDDGRTTSLRVYGTGIAQTTPDDENGTFYEDELVEPVLHDTQVDPHPPDVDDRVEAVSPRLSEKRALPRAATSTSYRSQDGQNVIRAEAFSPGLSEKRAFIPATSPSSRVSQDVASSSSSSTSKMPEFFSHAVFQIVLHNPTIAHQLLKFSQSRLCGENMEFLARVTKYHALVHEVSKAIVDIHKDFISPSAATQVNLPEPLLMTANKEMRTSLATTVPALENVFLNAQADIERLVYTDVYPKFVRHQMSVSAAKALGGDRAKYAGLGDCFVLTDPAKADNPIVFASDGFVKVTGYTRKEIIPRNCRFLQARHTDTSSVRRLKAAIDKREESVELLLNQTKSGEPFWNLLYTTPLFDVRGDLVFFLGGQVNCSTTIHNASEVLHILAQSKDADEAELAKGGIITPPIVKPPRSRSIFSAFRSNTTPKIQPRAPGMEGSLLDKLEDMNMRSQMNTFYTAYSNVRPPSPSSLILTTLRTVCT